MNRPCALPSEKRRSPLKGAIDSRQRQEQSLERIRRGVAEAPAILGRLDTLIERKYGVRWLLNSLKEFQNTTPSDVVSELKIRASRSQPAVDATRPRSAIELNIHDAANAPEDNSEESERRRYERSEHRLNVTERIGEFVGLEVFAVEGRALVFQTLKPKLQNLSAVDPERMSVRECTQWNTWLRHVDEEIGKVEEWLATGMLFFSSKQNVRLMQHVTTDADVKSRIGRLTWNIDRAAWK